MTSRALVCLFSCLVLCGCSEYGVAPDATTPVPESVAGDAASGDAATDPSGDSGAGSPRPAGAKYIPHVSEQKLDEFLEDLDTAALRAVTDDQVYAIMGEPTRRDPPFTGRKDGRVFTVYTAYWKEPGSGIESDVMFVNGRIAGMTLGLEVPRGKPVWPQGPSGAGTE